MPMLLGYVEELPEPEEDAVSTGTWRQIGLTRAPEYR